MSNEFSTNTFGTGWSYLIVTPASVSILAEQPDSSVLRGDNSGIMAAGDGVPGGTPEPRALRHNQQVVLSYQW